ncbi:MAG: hypothetical protein GWO20_05650 [Candidatus Korarchaeota archaeon]|nr:hypothetical protein [Candidatus Korarchaeota archaeon]NIU82927.1 hypothetical protein [Candidatus Thorarchaeota archaeon]NIW13355.1 hypothetical protein [Candidatus Thorarchaeota archaeon]NIW51455.1 hypothetical protein [Candidatus Korarchaeota archaeon]
MEKSKKCEKCETSMIRAYLTIGDNMEEVAWVCPNFPNQEWKIHYSIDQDFNWWQVSRNVTEDVPSNVKPHHQIEERANCAEMAQRVYISSDDQEKPIGWFCPRCNKLIFDKKWKKELEEKRKDDLRDLGAVVS